METENTEYFHGHSWETLPEDILHVCEPWQRMMQENGGEAEWRDDGGRGTYSAVRRLLWLIPLAKHLQLRPTLRCLHPSVHHAILQLSYQPIEQARGPFFFLYAEAEGHFSLQLITGPGNAGQELKVGTADEIADMLELALAAEQK